MDAKTREHILSYEDPEDLRRHLSQGHGMSPLRLLDMEHRALDIEHIGASADTPFYEVTRI